VTVVTLVTALKNQRNSCHQWDACHQYVLVTPAVPGRIAVEAAQKNHMDKAAFLAAPTGDTRHYW
jgi:hypothetical protein